MRTNASSALMRSTTTYPRDTWRINPLPSPHTRVPLTMFAGILSTVTLLSSIGDTLAAANRRLASPTADDPLLPETLPATCPNLGIQSKNQETEAISDDSRVLLPLTLFSLFLSASYIHTKHETRNIFIKIHILFCPTVLIRIKV